jgi:hypothetical protein
VAFGHPSPDLPQPASTGLYALSFGAEDLAAAFPAAAELLVR